MKVYHYSGSTGGLGMRVKTRHNRPSEHKYCINVGKILVNCGTGEFAPVIVPTLTDAEIGIGIGAHSLGLAGYFRLVMPTNEHDDHIIVLWDLPGRDYFKVSTQGKIVCYDYEERKICHGDVCFKGLSILVVLAPGQSINACSLDAHDDVCLRYLRRDGELHVEVGPDLQSKSYDILTGENIVW